MSKRGSAKDRDEKEGSPTRAAGRAPIVFPLVLAYLVPGAGHVYLKRHWHGLALLAAISGMFFCGILMQGRMFVPTSGNIYTTIMTYGGYVGDLCNGLLYILTVGFGYEQETLPGAVHDYGTKFIVCSGLLNLLAVVDVFEIASGEKAES